MASNPSAARETVFRATKFSVDRVLLPRRSGGTAAREIVHHHGAVVVLSHLDDGRIVLIRNHRFAIDSTLWELPAGTLEEGEDPRDCALRELLEETGYRAGHCEPLLSFYTSPGFCDERIHAFVASDLVHEGAQLEETERIETHPTAPDEVRRMVAEGEIEDGKTLLTLYHAWSQG